MTIPSRHTLRYRYLFLALMFIASAAFAAKSAGDLTGPWQLFVDDYLVSSKSSIVRTYHHFEKH